MCTSWIRCMSASTRCCPLRIRALFHSHSLTQLSSNTLLGRQKSTKTTSLPPDTTKRLVVQTHYAIVDPPYKIWYITIWFSWYLVENVLHSPKINETMKEWVPICGSNWCKVYWIYLDIRPINICLTFYHFYLRMYVSGHIVYIFSVLPETRMTQTPGWTMELSVCTSTISPRQRSASRSVSP